MAYFECLLSQSSGGGGAVLTVTCDSALSGATISCTDGTTTLTAVCPSSSPYEVEFNIPNSGTWTISGLTYTASVVVNLDYEVELGGFNYRAWLTAGGLDPSDYASLSAVLADEKAIRQLFLVHASVDYLASVTASDASVETIIEDNYCAKWINESDYALFTLYDNSVIADLMDEADKYFYGEWGIVDSTTTPPTWGAKGNIPVMTSNTAPYGVASRDTVYQTEAWQAFDGDDTSGWYSPEDSAYVQYKHTNPVRAKRAYIKFVQNGTRQASNTMTIKGSNDGSNWVTLGTYNNVHYGVSGTFEETIELSNDEYYLYHRLEVVKTNTADHGYGESQIKTLQFYGHELKVSVPTMTSNTSPYGEVIKSSEYSSQYPAWYAFDQNTSTLWAEGTNDVNAWVGYKFSRKTILKKLRIKARWARIVAFSVQGSNDGVNFEDIATPTIPSTDDLDAYFDIDTDSAYTSYRACVSKAGASSSTMDVKILQFYCLDYSEKEFEPNTNRKWLYDHGVELEELYTYGSNGSVTKESDQLKIQTTANSSFVIALAKNVNNLGDYNLVRTRTGKVLAFSSDDSHYGHMSVYPTNNPTSSSGIVATGGIMKTAVPNNASVNISVVTNGNYPAVQVSETTRTKTTTITEWWLE